MKYSKSLSIYFLLFIFYSDNISAQQYYWGEFINQSITLRSDSRSKSVLITNMSEDKTGDLSPVMIAASWADSSKQFECRSFLEFNYISLPKILINDPSLISSAELILFPVNEILSENNINKAGKFFVRRVTENWEDSVTVWSNQPSADSSIQIIKKIKMKQKNNPVFVDVTKLVREMLLSGNKGFMICSENTTSESNATGVLFASPKNNNETLRPLLVINYREHTGPALPLRSWIKSRQRTNSTPRQTTGNTPLAQPAKNTQEKD
jgi:hypothetical protein